LLRKNDTVPEWNENQKVDVSRKPSPPLAGHLSQRERVNRVGDVRCASAKTIPSKNETKGKTYVRAGNMEDLPFLARKI